MVVVGPDGVGKTTLAEALLDLWDGPRAYFHFCPELNAAMRPYPDTDPPPPPPKAPRRGSRVAGWVRLARNLVKFWIAYLVRIRPLVRRGGLVVGDRWSYGYVGQPHALRFYGPAWLGRLGVGLFPQPDAVLSLSAPSHVIRSRKQELEEHEIVAELERWASLPEANRYDVEAMAPPELMAEAILERLGRA